MPTELEIVLQRLRLAVDQYATGCLRQRLCLGILPVDPVVFRQAVIVPSGLRMRIYGRPAHSPRAATGSPLAMTSASVRMRKGRLAGSLFVAVVWNPRFRIIR